jgi:hypothetical protein
LGLNLLTGSLTPEPSLELDGGPDFALFALKR